jgi:hypothetical protein
LKNTGFYELSSVVWEFADVSEENIAFHLRIEDMTGKQRLASNKVPARDEEMLFLRNIK